MSQHVVRDMYTRGRMARPQDEVLVQWVRVTCHSACLGVCGGSCVTRTAPRAGRVYDPHVRKKCALVIVLRPHRCRSSPSCWVGGTGTRAHVSCYPVLQITIPTNVYCSPGGECYHTSRKCEGLKNVPMDGIRRRRSCMYCVQRNGQ